MEPARERRSQWAGGRSGRKRSEAPTTPPRRAAGPGESATPRAPPHAEPSSRVRENKIGQRSSGSRGCGFDRACWTEIKNPRAPGPGRDGTRQGGASSVRATDLERTGGGGQGKGSQPSNTHHHLWESTAAGGVPSGTHNTVAGAANQAPRGRAWRAQPLVLWKGGPVAPPPELSPRTPPPPCPNGSRETTCFRQSRASTGRRGWGRKPRRRGLDAPQTPPGSRGSAW